jgi:hypothetical protein
LGDEKLLENSSVFGKKSSVVVKNPALGARNIFQCMEKVICAIQRICRNFPSALASKFEKIGNRTKKNCLQIFKKGIKNAEFNADFKAVEKIAKNIPKNSYDQKCEGNMNFFHFNSCPPN